MAMETQSIHKPGTAERRADLNEDNPYHVPRFTKCVRCMRKAQYIGEITERQFRAGPWADMSQDRGRYQYVYGSMQYNAVPYGSERYEHVGHHLYRCEPCKIEMLKFDSWRKWA